MLSKSSLKSLYMNVLRTLPWWLKHWCRLAWDEEQIFHRALGPRVSSWRPARATLRPCLKIKQNRPLWMTWGCSLLPGPQACCSSPQSRLPGPRTQWACLPAASHISQCRRRTEKSSCWSSVRRAFWEGWLRSSEPCPWQHSVQRTTRYIPEPWVLCLHL